MLKRINNKSIVLLSCIPSIAIFVFCSVLLLPVLLWGNQQYIWIFTGILTGVTFITILNILRKKYIDIHLFQNYMLIRDFYLLKPEKPFRSQRIIYFEIKDFYMDKNTFVFTKDNRKISFSAKYLKGSERIYLKGFLEYIITINKKA